MKLVPVRLKGTVRRVVGSRNLRGRKESGGKQELERKEGDAAVYHATVLATCLPSVYYISEDCYTNTIRH